MGPISGPIGKNTPQDYDQYLAEMRASTGTTSNQLADPDGLPSMGSIQSMSKEDIKSKFDELSKNNRDPLQFLAKTAVAAQKLGFDGPPGQSPGRTLISQVVELYARDIGVNPQKPQPDARNEVLGDLVFRAMSYSSNDLEGLRSMSRAGCNAFDTWVIMEQAMGKYGDGK